ncbi:MAG TPA: DUF4956 domain-containing protein [Gemmatimonadaceae bacterium]|nr:DUF4956 domain-containing protein [Gemmatimonadaceae bacterium]
MSFFTRIMSYLTLGSSRPIRRLAAYYALLAIIGLVVFTFFPALDGLLTGDHLKHLAKAPAALLRDSISAAQSQAPPADLVERATFGLSTAFILLSTLALMLPVTWVYMSARSAQGHNQSVVQVLIVLPMIVAGVVLIVSNSLALAFSLGGVVAAVRFRTNMSDSRDIVFIFLAIAVGFAAGVQDITIALTLSCIFNFVLVFLWRYDFGRTVLEPTASSQWAEPLGDLAGKDHGGNVVPDRDLVLALTPKKVEALAQRFERVRVLLGRSGKKPRFDAVLAVTTSEIDGAQKHIEKTLNDVSKRWKLDEVVTNVGKPSELYYLIRQRKSVTRDAMVTAIRSGSNGFIAQADLEVGDALAKEAGEVRQERKKAEAPV